MERSNEPSELGRYQQEDGKVVIAVAVNTSSQLFNERDPAPFRARDLDENFVNYVLSSVQEFPLKTDMKLRIVVRKESDGMVDKNVIRDAIKAHFLYEAGLSQLQLKKRLRVGRFFFFMGLGVLVACLSIAEMINSCLGNAGAAKIVSEGFVIVGWVAMWRPVEVVLYDWWPMREIRLYLLKITSIDIEIHCTDIKPS